MAAGCHFGFRLKGRNFLIFGAGKFNFVMDLEIHNLNKPN